MSNCHCFKSAKSFQFTVDLAKRREWSAGAYKFYLTKRN